MHFLATELIKYDHFIKIVMQEFISPISLLFNTVGLQGLYQYCVYKMFIKIVYL